MLPSPEAVAVPLALVVALVTGCAHFAAAVANYLAKRQEAGAQARTSEDQGVRAEGAKLREALQSETRRLSERLDALDRLHDERGLRIDSLVQRVRHLETMNEELLRQQRDARSAPPARRRGGALAAVPRDAGEGA